MEAKNADLAALRINRSSEPASPALHPRVPRWLTIGLPVGVSALIFAVVMGMVGGFLPAARAARLDIVNALRAS